jgi:hypothetical protein
MRSANSTQSSSETIQFLASISSLSTSNSLQPNSTFGMEHADAAVWHTLRPENAAAPMLEKDGKGAAAFKLWAKGLGPRAVGASKIAKNGLGESVAPKLDKDGKGAVTAPKLEKGGKGAAAPTLDA